MARQATAPVTFSRSTRKDEGVLMSSGMAGVVTPILIIPLLKGDSLSGQMAVDVDLGLMPRPLMNPVFCNVQCWFVPKASFPRFAGTDEFLNSYTSTKIRALGQPDRDPPPYFNTVDPTLGSAATAGVLDHLKTLGLHLPTGYKINADYIDAFIQVYNFRLAAHSSKLPLLKYVGDTGWTAKPPPAFWPSGRWSGIVPDYEKALLVGQLDLDVSAGQIPLHGFASALAATPGWVSYASGTAVSANAMGVEAGKQIFGEMAGTKVSVTLSDIDKARTTQAFAKLRAAYAGNDTTGFMSDEMMLAYLMQGISVPADYYRRPWLLGQQRVAFGFAERHAMDGASLDKSSTEGRTSVRLPVNVPMQDVGGYIVATMEVLPERLDERATDEFLFIKDVNELPNALRDVQRTEPVDTVLNRRIDAKHASPDQVYGYERMNDVWNRSFTKLGGIFYQPDPKAVKTESRAGIWHAGIIDPTFNEDHFLAPSPFPHDVFADSKAPAFEFVVRHSSSIVGLTQIGDALMENNDDFAAVGDPDL